MKKILFLVFTTFLLTLNSNATVKKKNLVLKKKAKQAKQLDSSKFDVHKDGSIHIDGHHFNSFEDYQMSDYFIKSGKRCGTVTLPASTRKLMADGSDCTANSTTIKADYNLTDYVVIPVVFHIIYKTDGTGNISDEIILSQIDSMNKAYGADPSFTTDSANTYIQFELAGITRTANDDWFADSNEIAYKNALGWDRTKYLNVYVNSASGYLGYSYFPQSAAGTVRDGVVLNYSATGQGIPGQYNQGDTLNHEVGHYLGLYHTFEDGCVANTYTTGDCIVDTNSQGTADEDIYNCSDTMSCGTPNPIHNYMNYANDACLYQFTAEQSNRMVCSLLNYRPDLYHNKVDGLPEFSSFSVSTNTDNLDVTFTAVATDPDSGTITSYKWDFDNDGNIDATTSSGTTNHTYTEINKYQATVTAVDDQGQEKKSWVIEVNVGAGETPSDSYSNHLYIPLSQTNTSFTSYLGLQNPGDATTNYTINYIDSNGYLVASPTNGSIVSKGKSFEEVLTENIDNAYWVMIGYDNSLNAYLEMISTDGTESGAILASTKLESTLYVPHIAPETDFWNSYSSIVNGTSTPTTATFNYLTGSTPITPPDNAFTMNYFEWFDDLFSSGVPTGFKNWGIVESSSATLCGMEMFTTKGDLKTLGALDLNSKNSDTLYFAHVDVGGGNWWTGVVLENINSSNISIEIIPYDAAGNQLTSVSYTLTGYEKLVNVVQNLWTDKSVTYPTNTAWFKVVATGGNIIGYELFGTELEAGRKLLAGINAATAGKLKLTYPHIDVSATSWTGITVVNIGNDNTSLTAKAYDENGTLLEEYPVKTTFAPNEKYVNVAESIFSSGLPVGTKTITIESDNGLVGFELWGDLAANFEDRERMSGILAFGEGDPTPDGAIFFDSFEYVSTGNTIADDGWQVLGMNDDTVDYAAWFNAGEKVFTDNSSWIDGNPQTIPDGSDYVLGYYGSDGDNIHQLLVSPPVTLPSNVTTVEFFSQFGYPSWTTKSNFFYITEDLNANDGLTGLTTLKEFTVNYIKGLPMSDEVKDSNGDNAFTQWQLESFDISSFANKTVIFVFELDSAYAESWHLDKFTVK